MSRSREIGTRGENYFLEILRALFGNHVERAPLKGIKDHGDFVNVPWLHESKARSSGATSRPLWNTWADVAKKKTTEDPRPWRWVVMWKGDLRQKQGPYVLMSSAFYQELVTYARQGGMPQ
jgi:hypothetical protein